MIGSEIVKRTSAFAIAAAVFIAVAFARIYAASEIPIMETNVSEDSITLYLNGVASGQKAEAQIGTEVIGDVEVRELDNSTMVVTWLLLDNSLSITKADREKANKLMTDIAAGRLPNERITLCTISDHLHIILNESQNYAELKTQIDNIQYENQETYLTDVLDELLNEAQKMQGPAYIRCVVISDGVDNNPLGITREELTKRLAEKNIPFYSFGCKGDDGALKAMYSLSRQTGAKSWAMSDVTDTLQITSILSQSEVPLQSRIAIPETLRDGTLKGVRLSFGNGVTAETQLTMPFGTVTADTSEEKAPQTPQTLTTVPRQPATEQKQRSPFPLILCGAAAIAAVAALAFILLRKKKDKEQMRSVADGPIDSPFGTNTEIVEVGGSGSTKTLILVGDEKTFTLSLTDLNQPDRHYEVPLRNKATIGRNTTNQIVVDYDKSVSGDHCEIFSEGNEFRIRDLHSSNGTYVDGAKVVDTAKVMNGSKIKLGRVAFRVDIQ